MGFLLSGALACWACAALRRLPQGVPPAPPCVVTKCCTNKVFSFS